MSKPLPKPPAKPTPRTPPALKWLLLAFALVLGGLAFGLGALFLNPPAGTNQPAVAIGGPFRLETGGGRVVTDADLRGAPFLVFFGYAHCPDVCPTTTFQISEVLRALGPDAKVRALFITVDPERDTPAIMQDYVSSFDSRLIGLSGDRAAIDQVLREYRVYARKAPGEGESYAMDHSAVIYLMDRDGQFVRAFNLERPPEEAAAELRKLL
jgi:protein SCO1/2